MDIELVKTMLEKVWKKIVRREKFSLLAIPALLLWFVSIFYRITVYFNRKFSKEAVRLDTPVISVGNITVGGTGKTTTVLSLARAFMDEGFKVGIVSSGYGREKEIEIVEEGYKLASRDTAETGDEVKFMAEQLPEAIFTVAPSKSKAAANLVKDFQVDLLFVDDAFQHYELYRDIDIVTFDAAVESRQLRLFPAGYLREPFSSLKRAGIIIITRSNFNRNITALKKRILRLSPKADIYHAGFSATEIKGRDRTLPTKYLEDKSVFMFAGIGNFKAFHRQVTALTADIDDYIEFSDHQDYDLDTLDHIKIMADKYDSDLILTTGKDWVKLVNYDFGREIYYLNQVMDLDPGEERLVNDLKNRLNLVRKSG